jgi:site-specific DNA-adenine methylase
MKNHFIFPYIGNKRQEVELVYEHVKDDIDNASVIVEPFCGSSAFSFYVWKYHDEKKEKKYILNDDCKHLIDLYKLMKSGEIVQFIENVNSTCFNDDGEFKLTREEYEDIVKGDDLTAYFVKHKIYNFRVGLYPIRDIIKKKKIDLKKYTDLLDFIQSPNVYITKEDACSVVEKYKDDVSAFLFLDPPYMNTCNRFYEYEATTNIYKDMSDKKPTYYKCKMCFVLEYMWIIKVVFKDWTFLTYDKTYGGFKKKKVIHSIITNTLRYLW